MKTLKEIKPNGLFLEIHYDDESVDRIVCHNKDDAKHGVELLNKLLNTFEAEAQREIKEHMLNRTLREILEGLDG